MSTTVSELEFTHKSLSDRWTRVREDFWGDLKKESLTMIKRLLETSLDIELQDLIGARRWATAPHAGDGAMVPIPELS